MRLVRVAVGAMRFALLARAWLLALALSGTWTTACTPSPAVPDASLLDADVGPPDVVIRIRDATPDRDAELCPEATLCGTECVDVETDIRHCGDCDQPCMPPANAVPTCAAQTCGFVCLPGFDVDGMGCVPAPRPLTPGSTAVAFTLRPTFRWAMPDGLTEARLELCSDRSCATVLETIETSETEAVPTADLPAEVIYWRVVTGTRTSATWALTIAPRGMPIDRSTGLVPDYDGDGFGDVVVGAPRVRMEEGRAYAHLASGGGTPASATAIFRSPDGEGSQHGIALSCAGDVNGDGFSDLAIGAPRAAMGAGRVYLYLGGPDGLAEDASQVIDAVDGPGGLFGGSVTAAGDVDGDGLGDLLVGAIGEGVTPGRLHLYRGTARGLSNGPALSVVGAGRFASAVAGGFDLNGDGFSDVAVGAFAAGANAGEVHLFFGSNMGLVEPSTVIASPASDGQFGFSVASAGDVNGDGFSDLVVGAPNVDAARGSAFVFLGSATGVDAAASVRIDGINSASAFFGHAVVGFGDGDGDGYDDIVVGAFGVNSRAGRVTVLRGSAIGIDPAVRFDVAGPDDGGDFGWSLAAIGDVDRNGRADLLVGAPGANGGEGRAYVHRGGPQGITPTPLVVLRGASGGAFGRAVAHAAR
ncbi:MAG: FG-GAP-like repeat-containing protein [Myxococcota bacterium]